VFWGIIYPIGRCNFPS